MSQEQLQEKQRFDAHLRQLGERIYPSMEDGFDRELAKLRRVDEDVRSNLDEFYSASLGSGMAKNRFSDVKPNEGTIVRLRESTLQGDDTYINANYIDARVKFRVPFVYIATQAPMKNTVLDFWRMVYENDSAFIVMLCAVKENGKVKSETYWPSRGETYDMGVLSVTLVAENMRQNLIHRRLVLRSVRGDEKEVHHMQYVSWPDQGVPQSSAMLMEMIQTIAKSPRSTKSPIVVHCSGGVGRTGVFIGLHIALAQFQLGQSKISIPRIVRLLKACRSGMVRRKDQYLFLYYATQREMERMILSEKTGVNLLDSRPRLAVVPAAHADPSDKQMATPLLLPVPTLIRGPRWTSARTPYSALIPTHRSEARSTSIRILNNHTAETDAAAMESYLHRASSLSSFPRSPSLSHHVEQSSSMDAMHPSSVHAALPPASFLPRSLSISPPHDPEPSHWHQSDMSQSNFTPTSGNISPAHRSTSTLHEELARQQHANRLKRSSPSFAYGFGSASSSTSWA